MNTAVALVSIAIFVVAFRLARVVPAASDAIMRTRGAMTVLSDRNKSDDEKERAAREAAIILFGRFFIITGLTALALAPSALSLAIAVWLGIADVAGVTNALLSPWLIAAAIAFFVMDYAVRR